MIATLRGIIVEKDLDMVVIECSGVGYGVSLTAADNATLGTGQEARLYVYENIREDTHTLIGFCSRDSKALFEQLLSVKNVGPKVALAVLGIGSVTAVQAAIAGGDVAFLKSAKGVGKRAAEQMVVELRDKVGVPVGEAAEGLIGRPGVNQNDEAFQALIALGYSDFDAQIALQNVDKTLSTEQRIKQALKGK